MLFVCHPKILHKHCLQFPLYWELKWPQEKPKTMFIQNVGVTNKEHYGMFWYRPFATNHSRGTKPPSWRAKVALAKIGIILNGSFLCLSCPSATFALQHGGFVTGEWLAAKRLFSGVVNSYDTYWDDNTRSNCWSFIMLPTSWRPKSVTLVNVFTACL